MPLILTIVMFFPLRYLSLGRQMWVYNDHLTAAPMRYQTVEDTSAKVFEFSCTEGRLNVWRSRLNPPLQCPAASRLQHALPMVLSLGLPNRAGEALEPLQPPQVGVYFVCIYTEVGSPHPLWDSAPELVLSPVDRRDSGCSGEEQAVFFLNTSISFVISQLNLWLLCY